MTAKAFRKQLYHWDFSSGKGVHLPFRRLLSVFGSIADL